MTAICVGGGTSSPRSGQADLVIFGAGSIASILNNRGRFWASVVAPILGVMTFNLPTFCATDPPAMPVISALEFAEMLAASGVLASDATRKKFDDMVRNAVWHVLCQCDAGAAPVPPALPNPVGLPDTSRLYDGTGVSLPCYTTFNNVGNSQTSGVYSVLSNPDQNGNITSVNLPPGQVYIRTRASLTPDGASHTASWQVHFRFFGAGNANAGSLTGPSHPPDGNIYIDDFPLPPGGSIGLWAEVFGSAAAAFTDNVFLQLELFCGAPPGALAVPCCPADQFQVAMMQQILDYVTLLQRQLAPFAHVLGAAHAGLTGQGTIGVNGLLGVKLELTTIPAHYGVEVGSPDYHFDLGWLSVLTPDGFIDERRVSAQVTSWMPRLMSDATVVGYSLNPGVVGTLTEMRREP